jgi:low temperature requirement protein LtrA
MIPARAVLLSAVAAMAVAALSVPEVFDDAGVLFEAIDRLTPRLLTGAAAVAAAGFLEGAPRLGLWILGLAIDYSTPFGRGVRGVSVHARHFADRYGLMIILALGESIIVSVPRTAAWRAAS